MEEKILLVKSEAMIAYLPHYVLEKKQIKLDDFIKPLLKMTLRKSALKHIGQRKEEKAPFLEDRTWQLIFSMMTCSIESWKIFSIKLISIPAQRSFNLMHLKIVLLHCYSILHHNFLTNMFALKRSAFHYTESLLSQRYSNAKSMFPAELYFIKTDQLLYLLINFWFLYWLAHNFEAAR